MTKKSKKEKEHEQEHKRIKDVFGVAFEALQNKKTQAQLYAGEYAMKALKSLPGKEDYHENRRAAFQHDKAAEAFEYAIQIISAAQYTVLYPSH